MSYAVVPLQQWHLAWLEETGDAEGGMSLLGDEERKHLARMPSYTALHGGGVIACAGTLPQWPGRSIAWAYLHKNSGPHMRFITVAVRNHLAMIKGRIEATVRCDFSAGHRWMKMLGFMVETAVLPLYGPEGEAHTAYVRFN